MKTVKRTWRTKSGEVKTKIYTYDVKYTYKHDISQEYQNQKKISSTKNSLVFKSGKIKSGKLKQFMIEHGVAGTSVELDIERTLKRLAGTNKMVTGERLWASYTHDSIMGMLSNTGFTLEQIAEELDTSAYALLNKDNWSDNWQVFTTESGQSYRFMVKYDMGSAFQLVQ